MSIERKILSMGLEERLRFPGHAEDVADLIAAMDVVVAPSLSVGFGWIIGGATATGDVLRAIASSL